VQTPQRIRIAGSPSEAEVAAIVAAIVRFRRDTAPAPSQFPAREGGWLRAARLEAVGHDGAANPHFLKL
jgi:hypothetical protein